MTKKRMDWLDISKAIAIVLMIIGHTPQLSPTLRTLIFSFHMPLFFILSGYTFHLPTDCILFLKKSAKRLLIPYAATVLLAVLLHGIKQGILAPNASPAESFFYYIKAGLYGSGVTVRPFSAIPAIGSIWFLPCLFWARLIFAAILKCCGKNSGLTMVVCCLVTCAGAGIGQVIYLPWSFDIAMFSCGFLYLGYCAANRKPEEIKLSYLIPIALLWLGAVHAGGIELAGRIYPIFPFCFVGAAAGTLLTIKGAALLERVAVLRRGLCFLGRHSLLLLCVHKVDAVVINWGLVAKRLTCEPLLKSLLIASVRLAIALAGAVLCLAILRLIKKTILREKFPA